MVGIKNATVIIVNIDRTCFFVPFDQDVAKFCNRYPNIDLSYEVADKDGLSR